MDKADSFADFLSRLRAHGEEAARSLLAVYEPAIFHLIRHRLSSTGLSGQLDPEDICQEVWAKFFGHAVPQIHITSPLHLSRLLVAMSINIMRDHLRHAKTQRYGLGQHAKEDVLDFIPSGEDPAHHLEIEEEIKEDPQSPVRTGMELGVGVGIRKELAANCQGIRP